jgi:competence protein ComEA
MREISTRFVFGLAALLGLISLLIGYTFLRTGSSSGNPGIAIQEAFPQPPAAAPVTAPPGRTASSSAPVLPSDASVSPTPAAEVVVHVAGAVKKPGVYHLPPSARCEDAIKAAGGATAEANTDSINLAAHVVDGDQIYLFTKKEHPEGAAPSAGSSRGTKTSAVGKSAGKAAKSSGSGKAGKLTNPSQGSVNINTASAEELQRLPGVGPAMAERIMTYRQENGKFAAPEDLMQVSGIGEKKFAKMQAFVRVK